MTSSVFSIPFCVLLLHCGSQIGRDIGGDYRLTDRLNSSLAYTEIYLALPTVFFLFFYFFFGAFELYETDVTNVQLAHDFCLTAPKLGSKGVRAKAKLRAGRRGADVL
jgi:hypothetical protein